MEEQPSRHRCGLGHKRKDPRLGFPSVERLVLSAAELTGILKADGGLWWRRKRETYAGASM